MAELIDEATDLVHGDVGFRTDRGERFEVCDSCQLDNTIQPATGWCEACDELLCNDCYNIHCRPTMMRNHQLRSLQEMKSRKQTKRIPSKCDKHEGKRLKYYCKDHAQLGCSQCFVIGHRPCSKIVCISDVITRESNEFKALQLLLSKLKERLQIIEEKKERNLSSTGRQHNEAIVSIQEAGEKLKALIDTLVKEQIEKAEMTKDENIRNIDTVDGIKKEVEEELTTASDMLAAVKGDNNQLFVTMKHLQGEANVLESRLGDLEQNNIIKEYEFVLDPELAHLLDTVKEFGTLKDTRELNMDKATDEFVAELEVQRFQQVSDFSYFYDGIQSCAIQMSTDRDIRLLHVLLYPCNSGDTFVKLNIEEDSKCLISCTSTHAKIDESVAVKVRGDGRVNGLTLQAGHRYDFVVTITGGQSPCGTGGLAEVTVQGVKFSFSNSKLSYHTDVTRGQIPGFRFSLL